MIGFLIIGWLLTGFVLGLLSLKLTYDWLDDKYPQLERSPFWIRIWEKDIVVLVYSSFIGPFAIIGVIVSLLAD